MYDSILSNEDCEIVAKKYFKEGNVKVLSHSLKPVSEKSKGIAGEHLRLNISCQIGDTKKEIEVFGKTKPLKNDSQKDLVEQMNIYEKEIFFYDAMLAEFEKYCFDTSFAPKYYCCVHGASLVMENITLRGFSLAPIYVFYNVSLCKAGMKALALLHASGFALEEKKSKELERQYRLNEEYQISQETFLNINDENCIGIKWINSGLNLFGKLIDLLPESEIYKTEFKKKLNETKYGVPFCEKYNIRKTLGHGDLWSNNMMFKMENGVAVACCLLDFQLVRYFFPSYDVLLYLYANTSRDFRQEHMSSLIDFYFETLSDEMHKLGYNIEEIHPRKTFDETLNIIRYEAMIQGFTLQSVWCYTEDFFTELVNSGADMASFWFNDRSPYSIKTMQTDAQYRYMMLDILYDIHDVLFQK